MVIEIVDGDGVLPAWHFDCLAADLLAVDLEVALEKLNVHGGGGYDHLE